jgi:hypothetical protein
VGVSVDALSHAIHVCALFNVIVRIADAIGIEALSEEQADRGAQWIVDQGY